MLPNDLFMPIYDSLMRKYNIVMLACTCLRQIQNNYLDNYVNMQHNYVYFTESNIYYVFLCGSDAQENLVRLIFNEIERDFIHII